MEYKTIQDIDRDKIIKQLVDDAMSRIYGKQWENHKENPIITELTEMEEYLTTMFNNAPISMETWLGMLVRKNGGFIPINRTMSVNGKPCYIGSIEWDETYGTFLRWGDNERYFGDEFAYLDNVMTSTEMDALYCQLTKKFNTPTNNEKAAYINAIYYALKGCNDSKFFNFYEGTKLVLPYNSENVENELLMVYRHEKDDTMCLSVRIDGNNNNEPILDLLEDFDVADLKQIVDVFIRQFYEPTPSDQITDQEFREALDRLNQISN